MKSRVRLRYLLFFTLLLLSAEVNFAARTTEKKLVGGSVTVTAPNAQTSTGANYFVNISAGDTTGQGITGFDARIQFDPAVVQFLGCSTSGTIFSSASVFCNLFPTPNVIAVNVNGITPVSGAGPILRLNFQIIGSQGQSSPLDFVSFMFNEGDPASPTVNGSITILSTTAANVSVAGFVRTASGAPIRNARISILAPSGAVWPGMSNAFGAFIIEGMPAGETYVVATFAKGYSFEPVTLSLSEDVTDLVLVSNE
jgi:hypothetical protein